VTLAAAVTRKLGWYLMVGPPAVAKLAAKNLILFECVALTPHMEEIGDQPARAIAESGTKIVSTKTQTRLYPE
jgi:hypothetical protein